MDCLDWTDPDWTDPDWTDPDWMPCLWIFFLLLSFTSILFSFLACFHIIRTVGWVCFWDGVGCLWVGGFLSFAKNTQGLTESGGVGKHGVMVFMLFTCRLDKTLGYGLRWDGMILFWGRKN
jgi:hypothetical protein